MVADIRAGSGGSYVSYLTVFNNELYFYARDQELTDMNCGVMMD